jgi:hypothetical protein
MDRNLIGTAKFTLLIFCLLDPFKKREDFAVSLRKKKKQEILLKKRLKLI